MLKEIESVEKYVLESPYAHIGVPVLSLVRFYNWKLQSFGWEWQMKTFVADDILKKYVKWTDKFKWNEKPMLNCEPGLTAEEMATLKSNVTHRWDEMPAAVNLTEESSEFEKLICDIKSPNTKPFYTEKDALNFGRWKAKNLLKDAFPNSSIDKKLLDDLQIYACDLAMGLIIFGASYELIAGCNHSITMMANEKDYNAYLKQINRPTITAGFDCVTGVTVRPL